MAFHRTPTNGCLRDLLRKQWGFKGFVVSDYYAIWELGYRPDTHETATFDAENDRLTSVDRAWNSTSYAYDSDKRLFKTTYVDQSFTQTNYDPAGRVSSTLDANGNSTTYGYDDAGRRTISVVITAMEILVDNSGYPTEKIARNSHDYRPLGLGYANLGAVLMSFGLPYDSAAGRDLAAALTAIMCGQAYLQSAVLAANCPALKSATPLTASVERQGGACPGFYVNREPFLNVIRMHRAEVNNIGKSRISGEPFMVPQLEALIDSSRECWDMALSYRRGHGYRNSQTTVLALGGEGPLAADVAGEGEPPGEQGADAVAVAGQERDVDEQPDHPAHEAADLQGPG